VKIGIFMDRGHFPAAYLATESPTNRSGDVSMKRIVWSFVLLLVALLAWGCGGSTDRSVVPEPVGVAAEGGGVFLCGNCGQIKGSDDCCRPDAESCSVCSLAKGSPGCCKIEKGTDVKLCTKCGQVGGSEVCCAKDAEKCPKCNLAKGSPGCCKIGT
jgi:hypothetical protein